MEGPPTASLSGQRRIPVAKPSFGETEERLIREVLQSGWVTQGPRVAEFERRVADYVGVEEAIAVTSGTTALFLTLRGLGIGAGDEVLVPSLSFIASANAVVHAGATPVLVDVDPRTLCIDPDGIEAAITPKSRAIMPVDQLGIPADIEPIRAIADRHDLRIIQDAACAMGSYYHEQSVGGQADAACFSFHPRKVVVTGEGGMITTNDGQLAERLRLLRHQGMSISDLARHQSDQCLIETYPIIGYNFRLTDLQAALGIAQMDKLKEFILRRRAIAARYEQAFADVAEVELIAEPDYGEWNYQSYILRLRDVKASFRDTVLDRMQQRGIATRRGVMAIHRESCYALARGDGTLKQTESAADQTLLLPIYSDLTVADQEYVIHNFLDVIKDVAMTHRSCFIRKT